MATKITSSSAGSNTMVANAAPTFDASKKALSTLQGLPFDSLIGAPLNACVKAQANAAKTTIKFIEDVGLQSEVETLTAEDGTVTERVRKDAVYVYFNFIQGGRRVTISVPLLTMVPIPYIAINTIDINFKATVTGIQSEGSTDETEFSKEKEDKKKKAGLGWFSVSSSSLNTTVSTKKDSASTKNSDYSVEATIDVSIHASQDSMPAGMAKVLEMLGSAMDLCDPNGELTVNQTEFLLGKDEREATLVVSYKTPEGIYDPSSIYISGADGEEDPIAGTKTYKLKGSPSGTSYVVTSKTSPRSINIVVKTA